MRIAITYTQPIAGRLDSQDILDEAALIENSLDELKYAHDTFPVNPEECLQDDFSGLINSLRRFHPDVVFNMVEEGGSVNDFVHTIPGVLKAAGFAVTGCRSEAMRLTTDKCLSKEILEKHGIPTPQWALSNRFPVRQADGGFVYREPINLPPTPVIIKPAWEDASVGIDGGSVIYDIHRIPEKLIELHGRFPGQPILIESFIDGREINMSALQRSDGSVEVFPAAEMLFNEWPDDKPRIVDYTAKWDTDSFEYNNTVRKFNPLDAPTRELNETTLKCWSAFKLSGYARVDMRLSAGGRIYVIEVNANPCIAKDSGFIAAAHEAGLSTVDVIREILKVAQNG
jgi:D-alanine-D-alanine ligase